MTDFDLDIDARCAFCGTHLNATPHTSTQRVEGDKLIVRCTVLPGGYVPTLQVKVKPIQGDK